VTALANRPLCAFCGKPLRLWTTGVHFRTGERTKYDRDTDYSRYVMVDKLPQTRAEAQSHSDKIITSVRRKKTGEVFPGGVAETGIIYATEWDGIHFHDGLFCTGTCADRFARAAYSAGYRSGRKP
jgi:hypothetical protein